MSISTVTYQRKPLFVEAIQVTEENMDELSHWCQSVIEEENGRGRYIHVRVHNPVNPRQTKAFPNDWILYTDRGYKVYTPKAFESSFEVKN